MIIDCFAGGGGASVGIEMALGRCVDIAINHDPAAILMHKTNHPHTKHLTEDIFEVDLQKYVKDRHVDLMWASPDCTSHSKAKGGKPREAGLRILPWAVYKHAKAILPDVIIMENVEEIQQWGPLDEQGYPIKEKKGEEYQKFISKMKSLGYAFDSRELVAADYGAPTTRKRWYAIFRRDGKPIIWPEPTHNKNGTGGLKKWVAVSTVLDFSNMGKSIFGRKKPLADNTLKRIARGLQKFVFENPEPFLVQVNHSGDGFRGQSIHEPLPTVTQKHGFGQITPCAGWRGLYAVYIYVLLEIAVWGPGIWSVPYLYIWLVLFAAARALRNMESVLGWAALSGCFGLLFGALCAPVYWAAGGWQHALSWWLAGIPLDLLHGAGNFALALALFRPVKRSFTILLDRFKR